MSDRLLSMNQVTALVPFTKAHVYRLIKRGEFPDRIRIGKRRVCWREQDVHDWITSKIEANSERGVMS